MLTFVYVLIALGTLLGVYILDDVQGTPENLKDKPVRKNLLFWFAAAFWPVLWACLITVKLGE